ncbi:site-specific integrase [Achromobacter xylosoxidans]|uniref:site-specific integrase n=1 Tax=Alcaligenes xylosoxydans xylosoxydans TaxID=85698 RepID=UPI001EEAB261|nr:site-specific integrase [Achromobacter xylosoxidans]
MKNTSRNAAMAPKTNASKPSRRAPASTAVSMTVESYIDAARSAATKKAYAADLAHFLANGGKLPATPQQLCAYLANLAATLAVATIERRLIGIHRAHQNQNLTSPALHMSVRQTMQGIRRTLGTAQRRARAITKDNLLELLTLIAQQRPLKAARDRALLLTGFAGAFRRSELVSLKCEDISLHDSGMEILLRRSKTDQEGAGRTVFIPFARGSLCPVRALAEWQEVSGINSGYIFRAVSRHDTLGVSPLSGQSVSLILKAALLKAGKDHLGMSGHSLRAGFVTAAVLAGLQPYQIRAQTGHRSDVTLAKYIRPLEKRNIPSLL